MLVCLDVWFGSSDGWVGFSEPQKIVSLVGDGGSLPERVVIDVVNRLMRVKRAA